jgi:hypothetical protein
VFGAPSRHFGDFDPCLGNSSDLRCVEIALICLLR